MDRETLIRETWHGLDTPTRQFAFRDGRLKVARWKREEVALTAPENLPPATEPLPVEYLEFVFLCWPETPHGSIPWRVECEGVRVASGAVRRGEFGPRLD